MNDQIPTAATFPLRNNAPFNLTSSEADVPPLAKRPLCTGINPLVIASRPLLETISELSDNTEEQTWPQLQQDVIQAVKTFTVRITQEGYPQEVILIARYALCATLDETLLYNPGLTESTWQPYCLLDTFPVDHLGQEQFFLALERLCENSERYIDTLELVYLCLSLGFEGYYRTIPRGQEQLRRLMNKLYQIILAVRGETELALAPHTISPYKSHTVHFQSPIKLWQGLVVTVLLLGAIYGGLNYAFYSAEQPLVHSLQLLNPQNLQGTSSS